MAASQDHGFRIERMIRTALLGHSGEIVPYTAVHDIPGGMTGDGVPVSIKACGGRTVGFGDASRTWANLENGPLRVLIALHSQEGEHKIVRQIWDVLLTPHARSALLGGIMRDDVTSLSRAITAFGPGAHKTARRVAKAGVRDLRARGGAFRLNPKIDSGSQRRLQCSVGIQSLVSAPSVRATLHETSFMGIALPFSIPSSRRARGRP